MALAGAYSKAFNAILEDFKEEHPDSDITCDDVQDKYPHLIEDVEEAMRKVYSRMTAMEYAGTDEDDEEEE